MLIVTRYGKGIKDERWFRHREHLFGPLPVASMLAQTDGAFVWLIHIDADMPTSAREQLDAAVRPLGERVILNTTDRYNNGTLASLGKSLGLERDGLLLTGRIDDDDAWHVDTVKIIREKAAQWIARPERPEAYVMTFGLGLEWVMYDVYDLDGSLKAKRTVTRPAALRHFKPVEFQGDSVFVVAPSELGVTCLSTGHGHMQKFFRDAGYDVDWLLPETPMWLYTRHKQVSTNILHTQQPPLDFTLAELARDYGIDANGVAAYIAAAESFDHLIEKRSENRRTKALQALREIDAAVDSGDATPEMEERRAELLRELDDLENNLVGPIPT
jgi:hypothetical protein